MPDELNEQEQFVPSPPEPEITIRTMESDIKSLEQSGGQSSAPEVLEVKTDTQKNESGFNIPGYTGPEKAIFTPGAIVSTPSSNSEVAKPDASPRKTTILILIILAIAAGFGLLGYFVIFPLLFK